jgi:hypothetical protein
MGPDPNNNLVTEEQIVGELTYKKIKDDKKSTLKKLLLEADPAIFSDFVPLYAKLLELFGIGDPMPD